MQRAAGNSFRSRGASSGRGGGGRGRGRGNGSGPPASQTGLFADGIWHCNCTTRLPASHFQVKKDGKNKGRWFWTCQQADLKRCDFFLWDEDAKPREGAAVLSNSRTEPRRSEGIQQELRTSKSMENHGKGLFTPTTRAGGSSEGSMSPTPQRFESALPTKRSFAEAQLDHDDDDDDDDFGFGDVDEDALAELADNTAMQTPMKAMKPGVYATPNTTGGRKSARKLPWLKDISTTALFPPAATANPGPTTPSTTDTARKPHFDDVDLSNTTPSKAPRHANNDPHTPTNPAQIIPDLPPTLANPSSPSPPSRFRDALANPADGEAKLATEVLSQLAPHHLPADTISELRTILTTHDLRTQGLRRGRDIARVAVQTKEARIVELEARIASLEAERESDRAVIRKLRSAKAQGRSQVVGFGA